MNWLFEGHLSVYLVLGGVALVCFFLWWNDPGARQGQTTDRRRQRDRDLDEWREQVQRRRAGAPATSQTTQTEESPPASSGSGAGNVLWLGALLVALLLALTYFLLDRVETRNEQITRKLHEMANAVQAKDMKAILRHLSPRFRYFDTSRDTFELVGQSLLEEEWVESLTIWDVRIDAEKPNQVMLYAKPKGGEARGEFFLVRTQWVQDADGEWRMSAFSVHKPLVDSKDALPLPRIGP